MVQSVKIFVEIFSRMASNSQKSQKFRPAKYKHYTVIFEVHVYVHVYVLPTISPKELINAIITNYTRCT